MKFRPDRSITAMCGITVFVLLCLTHRETWFGSGSRRFAGVGGQSEYVRQRVEHLKRLRNNLQVTDPEVRAREIAEFDRQLAEVGFETSGQIGPEHVVERLEVRPNKPVDDQGKN